MRSKFIGLLAAGLLAAAPTAHAQQAPQCQFVLGFKALHDLIPAEVGDCLEDQFNVANGDAQQHTTKGLFAWRKADNWTAFTNGYRTWLNGPTGLVVRLNAERYSWEADYGAPGTTKLLPPPAPLQPNGRSWSVAFDHNLVLPSIKVMTASGQIQEAKAKGFWLNVYFRIRNNQARPEPLSAEQVTVLDKQGRSYVSDFELRQVDEKGQEVAFPGTIAPGDTVLLRLTFDVATGASGGILRIPGANDVAAL